MKALRLNKTRCTFTIPELDPEIVKTARCRPGDNYPAMLNLALFLFQPKIPI